MNDQIEFMMLFQYVLLYYVRPAIYLAIAVFGFIILFSKTKSTRILGLSFVLTSFANLLECGSIFVARFAGANAFAGFASASSIIQMVITIAAPLCMCIFIHRNYGKKLIYIPLLILPVLNIVARIIINEAFNNLGMSGKDLAMWLSTVNVINSFVIGAAVAIILIIVFYKNRKTEKIIPLAWIFEIINLAGNALFSIFLCFSYQTMYQGGKIASNFSDSAGMTAYFLQAVVSIAFPVYVMVMSVKKGKLKSA